MAHFNLQLSSAGTRFWSHVPQRETTNVHDWGQVCMFQGKKGPGFEAFTTGHESHSVKRPLSVDEQAVKF
jgi:hypothetical protein